MILERGTLLNNRYRIVEILGQGGMGSVYRAVDENLGVEVAVKDNLFTTDEYARQFRREAVILANLRHPNLPRVTDHFVIEGQSQYLVMDYIEGEDLRQRMERTGILPEEELVIIGAAVCDALAYLSSRTPPIIHRDIKPGNVKITPQGQIFLVDFGLAKVLEGSQATTTGARAMTPGYSPPEQYGTARTDQRSDIFSLGATLYAALTGATPEDALARAMDQATLTPVRKLNPKVSRRLASVIEKTLEVRSDDRYQTADEFKGALLGSSSGIRRRDGDFLVAPPPAEDKATLGEMQESGDGVRGNALLENRNSPQLLPVSSKVGAVDGGLVAQTPSKSRKRSVRTRTILVLLVVVILVGAGTIIYRYDSDLPRRAFAQVWPVVTDTAETMTPSPIFSLVIAGTQVTGEIDIGETPMEDSHETETALPTIAPTSTEVLLPTETLEPTTTPTSLPTPMGGGDGQIVFASDRTGMPQLYIINIDQTGLQQLTDLSEGACQPDWSPDGSRIVFISPCDSNTNYYPKSTLYIINADGSGILPLPTETGGDFDPRWSPDGNRILFSSLRRSGHPQLHTIDLNGYNIVDLSEQFSRNFQGSWSSDGSEIIYIAETDTQTNEIWVMDGNGQNKRVFAPSSKNPYSYPSWPPDQQSVLFTQLWGGIHRAVLAPYTNNDFSSHRIGPEQIPMRESVFSPDGYWIAFEGWEAGGDPGHHIYIISSTGSGLFRVTSGSLIDFDPDWKPVP